jgi:hypothetical protein
MTPEEEKVALEAAHKEADRWIAAIKFDNSGNPDTLASLLHEWKFEGEPVLGICCGALSELNEAISYGVAAVRHLIGEMPGKTTKPKEPTSLVKKLWKQTKKQFPQADLGKILTLMADPSNDDQITKLEPHDCIWDYYLFAFYESAYAGMSEKHPFISPLWFRCVSQGLGFIVNLGSLLVGLVLPEAHIDANHAIHRADGPALRWGEEKHWVWHNIELPKQVIEQPDTVTADVLLKETNQERKRAICEALGYERVTKLLGAKVIQRDDYGELLEGADLGDDEGRKPRWGRVKDPSTGRIYLLRVSPTVKTCREAMAETFGIKPADYEFDLET